MIDIASVLLVSFYTPESTIEKFMVFILIVCININSIFFMFTYVFFILSIKEDLNEIVLNLENITTEAYIDMDENTKNML